jgi:hypothetical protein
LQYTIEARELTKASTQRPASDVMPRQRVIEASDMAEALDRYLEEEQSKLISLTRPAGGHESIATMTKEDVVFLVRVYEV